MIDIKNIEAEWAKYVWSKRKVERFIEKEEHTFDILIKEFLKNVNRLPFVQTQYSCSGHARKILAEEGGRTKLFEPLNKLINLSKTKGTEEACTETLAYIEQFYSTLRFSDDGERKEAERIKSKVTAILEATRNGTQNIDEAKILLMELLDEINKIRYWNEIVIDEGTIWWYIFNFNKFTRQQLDPPLSSLRDGFIQDTNQLFATSDTPRLQIEKNIKSKDGMHQYVEIVLRYRVSKNDEVLDVNPKDGSKRIRAPEEQVLKYEEDLEPFWKKMEKISQKYYQKYSSLSS